jgi:hypothetical protein
VLREQRLDEGEIEQTAFLRLFDQASDGPGLDGGDVEERG